MPRKQKIDSTKLSEAIIEGLQKIKAKHIVRLDLSNLHNSVSTDFVICHGTSRTQVESLAESVLEETLNQTGDKPWHKEGFENAEWILLDYVDVVVHIFQEEKREFYKLENLWADAQLKEFND